MIYNYEDKNDTKFIDYINNIIENITKISALWSIGSYFNINMFIPFIAFIIDFLRRKEITQIHLWNIIITTILAYFIDISPIVAISYELYFMIHKLFSIIIPYIFKKVTFFRIINEIYKKSLKESSIFLAILLPILFSKYYYYLCSVYLIFCIIIYFKTNNNYLIGFIKVLLLGIISNYDILHIILMTLFVSMFYNFIKYQNKQNKQEEIPDIMMTSQIFESKPKARVRRLKKVTLYENHF